MLYIPCVTPILPTKKNMPRRDFLRSEQHNEVFEKCHVLHETGAAVLLGRHHLAMRLARLVGGLEHGFGFFSMVGNGMESSQHIPTDEYLFLRGVGSTSNQHCRRCSATSFFRWSSSPRASTWISIASFVSVATLLLWESLAQLLDLRALGWQEFLNISEIDGLRLFKMVI